MINTMEDYGSELQELQWNSGDKNEQFVRSGIAGYEVEELPSQHYHHVINAAGHHPGYYSPPGTNYTIIERPPSAQNYHSIHATPHRYRRYKPSSGGIISPEQVLRLFGNKVTNRRHNERRTPASSPASVSAIRTSTHSVQTTSNIQTSLASHSVSLQELTVRTITMTREPPDSNHGFGICVKGGKDAGVGVYISRVEDGSVAERAGLRAGDTILEVNGTPFRAVTHEEALKMLKSCRTLSMTVRGSEIDPRYRCNHPNWFRNRQQTCRWVDRQGRPASPPVLNFRDTPYGFRTRKVDLCIEPEQSLGLVIRGGLEYGLGIYITGIDKDSVADQFGLLVGDQILEVNGYSFEEATHDEAVQILKTSKRLSLLIRDVGKVPHSCTTNQPIIVPKSSTNLSEWNRHGTNPISAATATMVEEKARVVLARSERAALSQLLISYRNDQLSIEDLIGNLGDLLNTKEKLTLLTELRELIDNKDRQVFDNLVYRPKLFSKIDDNADNSDLIATESLDEFLDYDENSDRVGRRHSSPGSSRDNQDYIHHHLRTNHLESNGICYDTEVMIGRDARGNEKDWDRDCNTEDDEDVKREERNLENGSSGGWKNHLLDGLTQRVKSWYWGARPLEFAHKLSRSFDIQDAQLLQERGNGASGSNFSGGTARRHHSTQKLNRGLTNANDDDGAAVIMPDYQGNLRIIVKKIKPTLGIAIEGGANTKHTLPRIINIHDNGAAFDAGGLEVGQLILEVDGHKVEGLHHQEVARLIAESFARRDRGEIEFLVIEAKKSNLEPKPTALIFLES